MEYITCIFCKLSCIVVTITNMYLHCSKPVYKLCYIAPIDGTAPVSNHLRVPAHACVARSYRKRESVGAGGGGWFDGGIVLKHFSQVD
jgi:hypothetical protein